MKRFIKSRPDASPEASSHDPKVRQSNYVKNVDEESPAREVRNALTSHVLFSGSLLGQQERLNPLENRNRDGLPARPCKSSIYRGFRISLIC